MLPGVCLVQAAVAALARHRGRPARLTRVAWAKWLRPVTPDMPLTLHVALRGEGPDGLAFSAVFQHGAEKVAELRLCAAESAPEGPA